LILFFNHSDNDILDIGRVVGDFINKSCGDLSEVIGDNKSCGVLSGDPLIAGNIPRGSVITSLAVNCINSVL